MPPAAPGAAELQRCNIYLSVWGPGGDGGGDRQLSSAEVAVAFFDRRQTLLAEVTALLRETSASLHGAYLLWRLEQLPAGAQSQCVPAVLLSHLAVANPEAAAVVAAEAAQGSLQQQQQAVRQLLARLGQQAAAGSAAQPLPGRPAAEPAALQLGKNHSGWRAELARLTQELDAQLGNPSLQPVGRIPDVADWLLRTCGSERSGATGKTTPDRAACSFSNAACHALSLLASAARVQHGALASSHGLPLFSSFQPQTAAGVFQGGPDPLQGKGNRGGGRGRGRGSGGGRGGQGGGQQASIGWRLGASATCHGLELVCHATLVDTDTLPVPLICHCAVC